MNEANQSSHGEPASPEQFPHSTGSISSPSRRRLIRIGASSVPVLATLTSRSALAAGNCISTSAWGSDQISGSASEKARHNANSAMVTTGFTITAWNTAASPANNPTAPWVALKLAYPGFVNLGTNFRQNQVTFAQLVALDNTRFAIPSGFMGSDNVVGSLASNDKSYFAVAQLNFAANQKPPVSCVTDAVWLSIVKGTYPTSGSPWSLAQIALYLKNNNIVTF